MSMGITQETRREAYQDIQMAASNRRRLIYTTLRKRGPMTAEELAVFKRGRNAQVHSVPAHASRAQYAEATALEALLGWLYLRGQKARINELFCTMMEE